MPPAPRKWYVCRRDECPPSMWPQTGKYGAACPFRIAHPESPSTPPCSTESASSKAERITGRAHWARVMKERGLA